jgi:hypothetical protein
MKTKFLWVVLLASVALIGQAQGGGNRAENLWPTLVAGRCPSKESEGIS